MPAGSPYAVAAAAVAEASGPFELAALALFGDKGRAGDVLARLNKHGRWAGNTFQACKKGGHGGYDGDLSALVDDTRRLAQVIRDDV